MTIRGFCAALAALLALAGCAGGTGSAGTTTAPAVAKAPQTPQVAPATPVVAAPGQITGEALRALVVGATVHTRNGNGGPFSLTFLPNGDVRGEAPHADGTVAYATGSWSLKGDQVCADLLWNGDYQAPHVCRSFRKEGGKIYESRAGQEATFSR